MTSQDSPVALVRHEDVIQPFMLNNSIMRGRMVRLDETLNAILSRHAYHDIVSKQLGELLVIAAMLSSNLSEGGILTLQIKSDGLISMMVADADHLGNVRAYAKLHDESEAMLDGLDEKDEHDLRDLFGEGYFAITLDMPGGAPYQGVVPLEGESLQQAVEHYFSQSQQLDVMLHIHVSKRVREEGSGDARWVAAGIMLERMPDIAKDDVPVSAEERSNARDWNYQSLLVRTATQEELSDPHLAPQALLYRLFNEHGVWVYDAQSVQDQCRCSREKVESVLVTMPMEELRAMSDNGVIDVVCQFCSRSEIFIVDNLATSDD